MKSKFTLNFFLKLFNELIGLPIAVLIYLVTPSLLRLVDPSSGQFDTGQLAVISFGVIKTIVASLIAWVGFRLNFPKLYGYFINCMENDLLQSSNDQEKQHSLTISKYTLWIYFAYMVIAIFALQTI